MDPLIEIVLGIFTVIFGLLMFYYGWQTIILKRKILPLPVRLEIWVARRIGKAEDAIKFEEKEMNAKSIIFNGLSGLILGLFVIIIGILLLIE